MTRLTTPLTCTALTFTLGLGFASTGHAALITEAVGTPNTTNAPSPGDFGTAKDDKGGNATGDGSFGHTGTGAGGTLAQVGFGGNDEERRAVAEFALNSPGTVRGDIASAPRVILELVISNDPSGFASASGIDGIVALAVTDNAAEDGDITAGDYHAAASAPLSFVDASGNLLGTLLGGSAIDALGIGDIIRVDVTADAKAEALDVTVDNLFAAYRIQLSGTAAGQNTRDVSSPAINFNEARLVAIPEPASLALLGLGGLCMLGGRRRRA